MRRIKHKYIQQDLVFDRGSFVNLVIENPRFFREFLTGLKTQIEDKEAFVTYTIDGKESDLSKDVCIIYSPFLAVNDEKKDSLIIQKAVSSSLSDEQRSRLNDLLNDIQSFVKEATTDYPLTLEIDSEITPTQFFKSFSLRPFIQDDEFVNYFISELKQTSVVQKKSLFIFVSATDYLDEDEIEIIFKELRALDCDLLVLSGHIFKTISKSERRIIVDYDLCEL
ncbi:MAG: type II-A CRISPR-associated protein Csn2 [Bacillota bacterium]|nr:type II-A CRISPR-associated protein Csn2 [Bacillota bacterium]